MGGGDHRYLGLVPTNSEYATITATPFVLPMYPTPLTIPTGTDQVLNLQDIQKDSNNAYYECKNVEKSLQRHVQDAIDDKYLESLVDKDTQLIQDNIPTVLQFIFNAYGKIPSEEVKQKETELRTTAFNPSDPMIILCNPIKKLRKMAEAANIAYTENQILDIGLTLI